MQVPEGVVTITAEGRDLASALDAAARELGVEPTRVGHKLDLSHFRSGAGTSVPRTTVKIIAWESAEPVSAPTNGAGRREPEAAEGDREPRRSRERGDRDRGERRDRERRPGRDRERSDRGEREERPRRSREKSDKPVELRSPEATTTEASDFAQTWFQELLQLMAVEGTVKGTGNEERVHLEVRAEKAGRIIGKRGATLGAVRHLLGLALERRFGELTVDVDVDDPRSEQERAASEGGDDDRRKRRHRKKRTEGAPSSEKGRYPESKLRALARRAAEKAIETGQTITINLELNSYDRRLLHVEVAEIDGVESHSEEREVDGDDGRTRTVKYVQVVPST